MSDLKGFVMFRVCWPVALRLKRFTERPHYNRWLAGLHELFWQPACGHDWTFGLHMALIYWRPTRKLEFPRQLKP